MTEIRLGLIGDNIKASRAPALHRCCGVLSGLDVSYERLIPRELNLTVDEVFEYARDNGLRGVNVTLPYKERVMPKLKIDDPDVEKIGAANTVVFTTAGPRGHNTDFSAFLTVYRQAFGNASPGRVVVFGAGGVGRAVVFALKRLKAEEIIIIDTAPDKAQALADALNGQEQTLLARVGGLEDLERADGVVNCTPLGMVGYGGSPVPEGSFPACRWAFDAVYTPVDTPFKFQALAAGARFVSGYELYYYQGVDAFEIFTGIRITQHDELRRLLNEDAERLSA